MPNLHQKQARAAEYEAAISTAEAAVATKQSARDTAVAEYNTAKDDHAALIAQQKSDLAASKATVGQKQGQFNVTETELHEAQLELRRAQKAAAAPVAEWQKFLAEFTALVQQISADPGRINNLSPTEREMLFGADRSATLWTIMHDAGVLDTYSTWYQSQQS